MYVETPDHDEESYLSDESKSGPRMFGKFVVCGAAALVSLGVAAKFVKQRSLPLLRAGHSLGLDLVDNEVRIQMEVVGIRYNELGAANANDWFHNELPLKSKCELDPQLPSIYDAGAVPTTVNVAEQKNAFKYAIQTAVSNKAEVPVADVTIGTPSSNTGPASPPRTSFTVTIQVPSSLTTEAVMTRLNDGSTLLGDIKEALIGCNIQRSGALNVASVMSSHKTESTVMEGRHTPEITFEAEVKGVNYQRLAASVPLKDAFVTAVRSAVSEGVSLDAKTIALDISNSGLNAEGVPFSHVQARIPVPEGMTADATMSKWPGGRAGIGKAMTDNLKAISGIAQVTLADNANEHHQILVLPGPLHLGGVRASYRRQAQFVMEVLNLDHDPAHTGYTDLQSLADNVEQLLQKQVGETSRVEIEFLADGTEDVIAADDVVPAQDPLLVRASVSQLAHSASLRDATAWETKLLPAVRAAETSYRNSLKVNAADPYRWSLRVPRVSNHIDTIDFDFVIHGIDYNAFRSEARGAFLDDLATVIRTGLNHNGAGAGPGAGHINTVLNDIKVTVSAQNSGALNVRVGIPPDDTDEHTATFIGELETEVLNGVLLRHLETQLRSMDGIAYISTWTPKAISASLPGAIDDYSGDVSSSGDLL